MPRPDIACRTPYEKAATLTSGEPSVAAKSAVSAETLVVTCCTLVVIASTRTSWAFVVVTVVVTSDSSGMVSADTPCTVCREVLDQAAHLEDRVGQEAHQEHEGKRGDEPRDIASRHRPRSRLGRLVTRRSVGRPAAAHRRRIGKVEATLSVQARGLLSSSELG